MSGLGAMSNVVPPRRGRAPTSTSRWELGGLSSNNELAAKAHVRRRGPAASPHLSPRPEEFERQRLGRGTPGLGDWAAIAEEAGWATCGESAKAATASTGFNNVPEERRVHAWRRPMSGHCQSLQPWPIRGVSSTCPARCGLGVPTTCLGSPQLRFIHLADVKISLLPYHRGDDREGIAQNLATFWRSLRIVCHPCARLAVDRRWSTTASRYWRLHTPQASHCKPGAASQPPRALGSGTIRGNEPRLQSVGSVHLDLLATLGASIESREPQQRLPDWTGSIVQSCILRR